MIEQLFVRLARPVGFSGLAGSRAVLCPVGSGPSGSELAELNVSGGA
jgi:hypothetical protein